MRWDEEEEGILGGMAVEVAMMGRWAREAEREREQQRHTRIIYTHGCLKQRINRSVCDERDQPASQGKSVFARQLVCRTDCHNHDTTKYSEREGRGERLFLAKVCRCLVAAHYR